MRRSALFIASAAWAVAPVSAFADPINDAVYATAKAGAAQHQIDFQTCVDAQLGGAGCLFKAGIDDIRQCAGGANATWGTMFMCTVVPGVPWGDGLCMKNDTCNTGYGGYGGGSSDGAGASYSWSPDCGGWGFNRDALGQLIVPSVSLKGSGPLPKAQSGTESAGKYFYSGRFVTSPANSMADSRDAAVLRRLHLWNQSLGSTEAYWYGVYRKATTTGEAGYSYSRVASYSGTGALINSPIISSDGLSGVPSDNRHYNNPSFGAVDCPQGASGGTFDFYAERATTSSGETCTMYAPTLSGGKGGYAYPRYVIWPNSLVSKFPQGRDDLKDCRLNPALIRQIVEKAFEKAGYAVQNPPVQIGPVEPTIGDLDDPTTTGPVDPQAQDPTPAPSPTPTASPTGGSTTSPTLDLGPAGSDTLKSDSNLTAPDWSWWPSMPAIAIGTSAQCPTYQFTVFDMQFTLDAHCTFIEQYRALIAALMVIVFTIAAARVVLQA